MCATACVKECVSRWLIIMAGVQSSRCPPPPLPPFQDLKSSNMLEVSMALIIICKLMGAEMIPPLLPLVQDKLLHPK